jgi:membrane protein involved in colicin uptake
MSDDIFDQPMSAVVGNEDHKDANIEAEKQREAERRAKAAEAKKVAEAEAQKVADAKKADEDAKKDGPVVHGEHAQRYVNKTSRHSERYENHP